MESTCLGLRGENMVDEKKIAVNILLLLIYWETLNYYELAHLRG